MVDISFEAKAFVRFVIKSKIPSKRSNTAGVKKNMIKAPATLKRVCIRADRLELLLPTKAATSAVKHVPIFSPMIIYAARSTGIQPLKVIAKVRVIDADEDCNTKVITNPIMINSR